jgi:hypothetical protein
MPRLTADLIILHLPAETYTFSFLFCGYFLDYRLVS